MSTNSVASTIAALVRATVQPNSGRGTLKIQYGDEERAYEFTLFDDAALEGRDQNVDSQKIKNAVENVVRRVLYQINNQPIHSADFDFDDLSIEDFTQEVRELESRQVGISGQVYDENGDTIGEKLSDTLPLATLLGRDAGLPSPTMPIPSSFSPETRVFPLFPSDGPPVSSTPTPSTFPTLSSSVAPETTPAAPPASSTPTPNVSTSSSTVVSGTTTAQPSSISASSASSSTGTSATTTDATAPPVSPSAADASSASTPGELTAPSPSPTPTTLTTTPETTNSAPAPSPSPTPTTLTTTPLTTTPLTTTPELLPTSSTSSTSSSTVVSEKNKELKMQEELQEEVNALERTVEALDTKRRAAFQANNRLKTKYIKNKKQLIDRDKNAITDNEKIFADCNNEISKLNEKIKKKLETKNKNKATSSSSAAPSTSSTSPSSTFSTSNPSESSTSSTPTSSPSATSTSLGTPAPTAGNSAASTSTLSASSTSSFTVTPPTANIETVVSSSTSQATPIETTLPSSPSATPATPAVAPPVSPSTSPTPTPSATPATPAVARISAKETARGVNQLTLSIKPLNNKSASSNASSSLSPKLEKSAPTQQMLPANLKDVPFQDVLKNGKILTEDELKLILDFRINISAEKRAELLSKLMISAMWVRAINGRFKECENNVKKLEERQAFLSAGEKKLTKEETELNAQCAKLEAAKKELDGQISSLNEKKERLNLANEMSAMKSRDYGIKQDATLVEKNEQEIKSAEEQIAKLKAKLEDVLSHRKPVEEMHTETVAKLKLIISDLKYLTESKKLELAKEELNRAHTKLSEILKEEVKKELAARRVLQDLNNGTKGEPLNEEYKKEFEKEFFIRLSKALHGAADLNALVCYGLERITFLTQRWGAFNQGLTGDTKTTDESWFILGVEVRELLNIYLGVLDETFHDKPFVRGFDGNNKGSRPFLTALLGEYSPQEGAFSHLAGNGLIFRNKDRPYFSTPPGEWVDSPVQSTAV